MKVLLITNAYPPHNAIASLRPYSWAKYWTKQGHTVHVLTTRKLVKGLTLDCSSHQVVEIDYMSKHPFISRYIVPSEIWVKKDNSQPSGEKKGNGLSLRKKIGKIFSGSGAITNDCRMPNLYQLWVDEAVSHVIESNEKYDVAVATFAPFATFKIGYKLKQMGIVKRLVFDYRDLWIESPFKGVFGFRPIEKYLEKKWVKETDAITTVSAPLAETLSKKFNREVKIVLNGFDTDDLKNAEKCDYFNPNTINIIYAGSLYGAMRDPEPIFAALGKLKDNNFDISKIHLYIASGGGSGSRINELIQKYNIDEAVSFLGSLPRAQVLYLQTKADILLFLAHNGSEGKGFLGGKLSELLFARKFVWVLGGYGDPAEIFENYGAGKYLGNDVDKICKNLISLVNDGVPTVKENADEIKIFTREYQANNMLELIQNLKYE